MFDNCDYIKNTAYIDLRKEFSLLQKDYGLNILYIRTNKFIRCSCYDNLSRVGDPSCKKCFGKGYLYCIEPIKAIKSSADYGQDGLLGTTFGLIPTDSSIFCMDYTVQPKRNDIILICKYNEQNIPVEVSEVYQIQNPAPTNGDNGRIEFYYSMCKLRQDKFQQMNKMIKTLDRKAKIYLSKGKRYVCQIQN